MPARRVASIAALTAVLAVAGCTSSHPVAQGSSSAPASTASAGPSITDSTEASPTASGTATSATPTATSPAPPATSPAAGDGCSAAQLTVGVIRGSAAAQQEFALLTFTNSSAATCTLYGFPGVSLRAQNALLGQPAERSTAAPATVRLAPGQRAQTTLTDFSSCQASVSDTVRIYPPNSTQFVDKPLELRGCRIVVDPVTHS